MPSRLGKVGEVEGDPAQGVVDRAPRGGIVAGVREGRSDGARTPSIRFIQLIDARR